MQTGSSCMPKSIFSWWLRAGQPVQLTSHRARQCGAESGSGDYHTDWGGASRIAWCLLLVARASARPLRTCSFWAPIPFAPSTVRLRATAPSPTMCQSGTCLTVAIASGVDGRGKQPDLRIGATPCRLCMSVVLHSLTDMHVLLTSGAFANGNDTHTSHMISNLPGVHVLVPQ